MAVIRNSFYSIVGTTVPVFVTLITVPLYIRQIGADRYGALAIAWLMLGYFGQADFGIGRAVTQRVASLRHDETRKRAQVVASALVAIGGFGVVGGLAMYGVGHIFFGSVFKVAASLRGELLASLWMLALCSPLVALTGVASGSLMGLQRFKLVAVGNMVSTVALQLFPLLVAFVWGAHLSLLIGASLFARALGLLILVPGVLHAFFRGVPIAAERSEIVALLHFGKWVMVTALVGPLMILSDRLAIGALLGAVAVAAYTIPFQMASRTMMLPAAVVQVLFPTFAEQDVAESRSACATYARAVANLFAPVVLALICFAQPLLTAWLGADIDPRSVPVGRVVLAGFWANAVANVPYAFIQARGDPRFTALLHVAELPAYFLLLLVLGYLFGLPGMAAAFSIRCAIDGVVLIWRGGIGEPQVVRGALLQAALLVAALLWSPVGWFWSAAALAVLGGISCVIALRSLPRSVPQAAYTAATCLWRRAFYLVTGSGKEFER